MYKVNVNDKHQFEILPEDINWDLVQIEAGKFHILFENRSYTVVVLAADYEEKSFSVRVNSHVFNLSVRDRFDLLAEQLGFNSSTSKKANEIKAPMPGLVLTILVEEGQSVKKGESVLILEAMKMENVLKAPADCQIKNIRVEKGNAVEKNQVLIDLQ